MLHKLIQHLPFGWSARLALIRIASQWQSLLTVVVGVLLAASIGANVPLYTTAIAQVGMVQRLRQLPPEQVHIASRLSLAAMEVDDLSDTWFSINDVIKTQTDRTFADIPGWLDQAVWWGETAPMIPQRDGQDIEATRMRVAYYEGWLDTERSVSVAEGTLPAEATDPNIDIEVAIGLDASIELGLGVGDELVLDQRGWDTSRLVRARITAVVRPRDSAAPYWMPDSPLRIQGAGEWDAETNLLTTEASFLRVAEEFIPQTRTVFGWRTLFDHTALPYSQIPEAIVLLESYETSMKALLNAPDGRRVNFAYSTTMQLPELSNEPQHPLVVYAREVSLLGTPFGLLLLQIGVLALFFLVVTAALVRRSERREIAMLQSRGAFDRQIVFVRGVEALVIAAIGAILAPFVARQLLVWLAPVFTGIEQLPLLLNPTVFIYASIAAGAAFFALLGTLRPVLRLPLILAGGAATRSDKQPWWQRYYIDVILALVGMGALVRLVNVDSPLASTQIGQRIEGDPLLLLAPALLFLALGSLLLRLFPGVMALFSRFFAGRRGLGGVLASWQVSREPLHYGRITFLLSLAIGIGWFATSFRATVDRSHGDQARYAVGTDVQLEERDIVLDVDRVRDEAVYLAMPAVDEVSSVLRYINVDISTNPQRPVPGELLAVNADTLGSVVYWRSDLGPVIAPRPPGEALELPTPGRELPAAPDRVGLWARMDQQGFTFSAAALYQPDLDRLMRLTQLFMRFRDDTGAFIHVPMEVVEVEWARQGTDRPGLEARSFNTTGWVYFEGAFASTGYVPQGNVRLEAIYFQHRGRSINFENDLRLSLADLTLIRADGRTTSLNWLEENTWELVQDRGTPSQGATAVAAAPDRPGLLGRQIIFDQQGQRSVWGVLLNYPEAPIIPAVASRSLLEVNNLEVGDTLQLVNVAGRSPRLQILDVVDYYPSLYEDQRPFLVADLEALLYDLNRRPSASVYPSEMWLRLMPGVSSQQFADNVDIEGDSTALVSATTLERTMRTLQTNPLALGLLGLLFLAFIVALALSVVGLLTYAALTAQSRRQQFGVLRALGMSPGRLVVSIALEQLFVMVTATLLGALLGALLSDQVVPTLAIGATGESITPPFVVQVETAALLQYGAIMLVVLALVLTASLLLVRRLSLVQTLRLGEE